eukprot:131723-Chlamydomonas_euryale.AAC.5
MLADCGHDVPRPSLPVPLYPCHAGSPDFMEIKGTTYQGPPSLSLCTLAAQAAPTSLRSRA